MFRIIRKLIPDRHPIRLYWHRIKALAAALRYGFPARKLVVIAVTGTDGKTTTVGMISHILRSAGRGVGAASTAFIQVNDEYKENETHLTSIRPSVLQNFLRRLVREQCEYAVIEVSSHGLVQGRVAYTWPSVATVTNTSPEHLDYHGTMDRYRKDKGIIFRMLDGAGTKVLNAHDESFALYNDIPSAETIAYNTEDSDMWITDTVSEPEAVSATLHTHLGGEVLLKVHVPGIFNLENALCAIGCAVAIGIPLNRCLQALLTFRALPGRMERIDEGQDFLAYVDFTMTEEAYTRTLETLRKMVKKGGRVMTIFGCCGNRMKEKRPRIARIVSTLSDVAIVAGDETYGEDPNAVVDEIWEGIDTSSVDAHKFYDRREAIQFAIRNAKKGDVLVFCGMGPFSTLHTLHGSIPWNERKVVREELCRKMTSPPCIGDHSSVL